MSQLDPPKHGNGNSPDKLKKLHKAYLYFKFVRPVIIFLSGVMTFSIFYEGILLQNYVAKPMMLGFIPVSHDIVFASFIISIIVWILGSIYIVRFLHKKFRIIRYAHISFCKCDRKRWYNKD